MLWVAAAGVVIGLMAGYLWGPQVSTTGARYAAVWLVCCLDALLELAATAGARDLLLALARLAGHLALTAILLLISDRLGLELYLAALAAMGLRMFAHVDTLLERWWQRQAGVGLR